MSRIVHVIGNGSSSNAYKQGTKGIKLTCNLPPFPVEGAYGTCMVDFKMMRHIHMEEIAVPGDWILGARPKYYMEQYPSFKLKHGVQIKEFFTELPKYAKNYTDFNCGHMATYYATKKLKADEVHMYGFNSIFDLDLKSCTDFYLNSDREDMNNTRLSGNWRPIWQEMFKEFKNVQFVLYHPHDKAKIPLSENVEVRRI